MPNPLQGPGPSPIPFIAPNPATIQTSEASSQAPEIPNQVPAQTPIPSPPKSSKKMLIFALIGFLTLLILGGAAYFLYPKFIKQKTEAPTAQVNPQASTEPLPSTSPQSTASAQVQTQDTNFSNADFTITGPPFWPKVIGSAGALVLFQNPTADSNANGQTFGASINVTTDFLNNSSSLDDYSKAANIQRQTSLIGYKLLSQTKGTLAKQSANIDVYSIKIGNIDVKQGQIYTIKNQKAYVLTFNSQAEKWDNYAQIFNTSAQSFKFIGN